MQISSISQINNSDKSFFVSFNSKSDKQNKENKNLYYTLAGLAVLGIAGIVYGKHISAKKPQPIRLCTVQDLNSTLSAVEKQSLEKELNKLDFSKYPELQNLNNCHQTDIFRNFISTLKMKTNRTIEMPKIITSNLPEERLPNVTEFFNKEFGFASKEINYNNEFLKSLDAISEPPVFVTVKNSENLIKDLNNNPEFSKRFYNWLDKNENITLVMKESKETPIQEYRQISLKFDIADKIIR